MIRFLPILSLVILLFSIQPELKAWEGMATPRLKVEGRYLKDPHGNIINLHGFVQTYSPWFNEQGSKWNNYDVNACLTYNKGIIDKIMAAGWKVNFIRLHMDPYWSNAPGCQPDGHELPNCFDETRFRKYLDEVFVPMAEYAISKGLYVVMRPPGVCPEVIGVEDEYNYAAYLLKVWDIVSAHPKIKYREEIMFELANEPVRIRLADGSVGSNTQAHFDVLKEIFQPVVNKIRENGFQNVLWVPGSGYQAQYKGYAVNPIEGENIGYAIHVYPGWFGSADGYEVFKREWDEQITPVANFAPILVTEMDWAPAKYNSSWGKAITGTAGGDGFGANFKKIVDDTGNVGWLLFTDAHLLAQFKDEAPAPGQPYTFLTDPEACPWPVYHWFKEYAEEYEPKPEFEFIAMADNGNGTFSNPVIRGDFPAPAVVRKDGTFYLVSGNQDFQPTVTVLESSDLVNWTYSDVKADELPLDEVRWIDEDNPESGCLIETVAGEWWAIISEDSGVLGQLPILLPVEYSDGEFEVLTAYRVADKIAKPRTAKSSPRYELQTNDNFRNWLLAPQWSLMSGSEESFSLLDRAGYLRLYPDVMLTQRVMLYTDSEGKAYAGARFETGGMKVGDFTGLALVGDEDNCIGIEAGESGKILVVYIDGARLELEPVESDEIYLRVEMTSYDHGVFYSSYDNRDYTHHADFDELLSTGSGLRYGLFYRSSAEAGGFADVDWFTTEPDFSEEMYYPAGFEQYSEESLTLTDLYIEEGDELIVQTKGTKKLKVIAVFADGSSKDVGSEAQYEVDDPALFSIYNGIIRSFYEGESSMTISFTGPLGGNREISTRLKASTFPLLEDYVNPNIWDEGSFDEETRTMITGQWGFGGWQYDGLDISDYKYLVVRLGGPNNANADFRLYDEPNYWSSPAVFAFDSNREVVVRLRYAKKDDGGAYLNPKTIYIAGFWSFGNIPFVIEDIFLTNSPEYDITEIRIDGATEREVPELTGFVYNLQDATSLVKEVKISGVVLSENIRIQAPAGYEIALTEDGEYVQTLQLIPTNGQVEETSIFIRIKAGLTKGQVNGILDITSQGAYPRQISLKGLVEGSTSVRNPDAAAPVVVKEEYYNVYGQRLTDPSAYDGVVLLRQYRSDGSIITSKSMKKW